jgi:uncharacterized protein GlcG (DUF336 family)/NAD-dependent dihydropyrimidine dehydrogenase PreA subunit
VSLCQPGWVLQDGSCVEVCPVNCIRTTPEEDQYCIDPEVCIACEQCALVCPVEAICLDVETPPEWQNYLERNANVYRRTKGEPMPVPVEKALKMIQAGHAKAKELDIAVSVAVVDEGGRLSAFGRMDRAPPMSVDMAMHKAYTAATFQMPTNQLSGVAGQSWFQSMIVSTQGKMMAVAGGLPGLNSPHVVGAVGVSGGTEEQDQECCRAAVAAY